MCVCLLYTIDREILAVKIFLSVREVTKIKRAKIDLHVCATLRDCRSMKYFSFENLKCKVFLK